jgi:hypothetical protein
MPAGSVLYAVLFAKVLFLLGLVAFHLYDVIDDGPAASLDPAYWRPSSAPIRVITVSMPSVWRDPFRPLGQRISHNQE